MSGPLPAAELGHTGLHVTRLGCGGVAIGELGPMQMDALGTPAVRAAWDTGVRYFDTAPKYGLGQSERWMGSVLTQRPRDAFVLSTKVGLVTDPEASDGYRMDFTRDGVLRSLELSLKRLRLDRVDILYIHDPMSLTDVFAEAYPTVRELCDGGTVRAIGIGRGGAGFLAECAREAEFDAFLMAGARDYTLMGQEALEELLPLCAQKGIAVTIAPYGHRALNALDRAREYPEGPRAESASHIRDIDDVCKRHGISFRAAALQFALAHPAVTAVIPGSSSAEQAINNAELMARPIPDTFWEELKDVGLIAENAPVPQGPVPSA